MYYCYSIKRGLFDLEMDYAKEIGVYLFYDEKNDLFYDKDDNVIEIKGKKIFPRTGALEAQKLVEAVIKHGGLSLVGIDDYEKTLNWPNYLNTDRIKIILTGEQILANPKKIVDLFGKDSVFFKTKNKNYSQIISVEQFFEQEKPFIKALEEHKQDDFIISDVVEIAEDSKGLLEYRAFIVNGQIYNISRVHDFLLETIKEVIMEKLQEVINTLNKTDFPKSYVVDLYIGKNKLGKSIVDVLECNPIIASGTYLYNTVFKRSEDLLHQCPSKSLPEEKIKYGPVGEYGYDVKNKAVPSICYKLPGGFAADLMSFAMFGTKSSQGQIIHFETTKEINPINLDLNSIKILESDTPSLESESKYSYSSIDELIKKLNKDYLKKQKEEK